MAQVATAFQRVRVNLRDIILLSDPAKIAEWETQITERRQEINTQSDAFEKTIISENIRQAYDEFIKTREAFVVYMDQIVALANENRDTEAFALLQSDDCYAAEQAEQSAILNLAELKKEEAEAKSEENERLASEALILVLGVLLGGILLAALIALYISRLVSNSVKKIGEAAAYIAEGELNANIDLDTKDEIGDVANECRKMTENLNEVMSNIHAASE
jgi:methyl-accepting chemotaxis protein